MRAHPQCRGSACLGMERRGCRQRTEKEGEASDLHPLQLTPCGVGVLETGARWPCAPGLVLGASTPAGAEPSVRLGAAGGGKCTGTGVSFVAPLIALKRKSEYGGGRGGVLPRQTKVHKAQTCSLWLHL